MYLRAVDYARGESARKIKLMEEWPCGGETVGVVGEELSQHRHCRDGEGFKEKYAAKPGCRGGASERTWGRRSRRNEGNVNFRCGGDREVESRASTCHDDSPTNHNECNQGTRTRAVHMSPGRCRLTTINVLLYSIAALELSQTALQNTSRTHRERTNMTTSSIAANQGLDRYEITSHCNEC